MPAHWWLLGVLLAASLGVAVFAYLPIGIAGITTGLFVVAVAIGIAGYGASQISVASSGLRVARFQLESAYIRDALVLSPDEAMLALGPQACHQDFLHTRPYLPGLVRIRLSDPADPHPSWLVSSRRAEELAAAVNQIAGGK